MQFNVKQMLLKLHRDGINFMSKDNNMFLAAALLFAAWMWKKKMDQAALLPADSNAIVADSTPAPLALLDLRNDQAINLDILDNPSPTNRPNPSALIYQVANEEETMFAGSSLG